MQLIQAFYDIFQEAQLPLWLRPYEVGGPWWMGLWVGRCLRVGLMGGLEVVVCANRWVNLVMCTACHPSQQDSHCTTLHSPSTLPTHPTPTPIRATRLQHTPPPCVCRCWSPPNHTLLIEMVPSAPDPLFNAPHPPTPPLVCAGAGHLQPHRPDRDGAQCALRAQCQGQEPARHLAARPLCRQVHPGQPRVRQGAAQLCGEPGSILPGLLPAADQGQVGCWGGRVWVWWVGLGWGGGAIGGPTPCCRSRTGGQLGGQADGGVGLGWGGGEANFVRTPHPLTLSSPTSATSTAPTTRQVAGTAPAQKDAPTPSPFACLLSLLLCSPFLDFRAGTMATSCWTTRAM